MTRNRRVARGLLAFIFAFVLLYAIDGSRQPTSGDGWRLLGYQRGVAGPSDVLEIHDQAELEAAWEGARIRTQPSHPDFGRVAVFWLTYQGTIGCPSRFEGLRIDPARHLVAGSFSLAITSGCDDNRVPDSFLLAIDRDRLPAAPYLVQLADPVPAGATGGSIEVAR